MNYPPNIQYLRELRDFYRQQMRDAVTEDAFVLARDAYRDAGTRLDKQKRRWIKAIESHAA